MIVIGDVHGCFNLLMELMGILPQTKDICFVGDLIDRGPDSKKVIDFIIKNNYQSVMGNHEDMFLNNIGDWSRNGANNTLKSFNTNFNDFRTDMKEYDEWFSKLPITIQWNDFLISHSFAYDGIDTNVNDILWGRWFFNNNCELTNIFGHTPDIKPHQIFNKHWNIDTGAYFTGVLTAIDLKTMKIYQTKGKVDETV